jgi:hypothetical protein
MCAPAFSRGLILLGIVVVSLQGCGGSEIETAVKDGVGAAKAARSARITVKDGGESKTLDYVKEGGDWVYKGCELLDKTGTTPNCTEPDDAPDTVTP